MEVSACGDSDVECHLVIGEQLITDRQTLERGVVPMLADIGASLLLHALGHTDALHMSLSVE